jgi:hypothetical protein
MLRSDASSITSDFSKDFLQAEGKDRNARLVVHPTFPRPLEARLDHDGYLTWRWYEDEQGGRDVPPKLQVPRNGLCFEFARLAQASDEHIRRFAERWGPLRIEQREEEHVDKWRSYAVLAQVLLRFAGDTAHGGRGSKEDWGTICAWLQVGTLDRPRSVNQQLAIAASAVNSWFAAARGHRILDVVEGQFQIRPGASNLFGVLGAQLAHAIARSDELARCAGCKAAFTPKRPISHGSRQYCNRCRHAKIPQRDASRAWRSRKR